MRCYINVCTVHTYLVFIFFLSLFSQQHLCLQRAAHGFQPQMKLEAVDKRSPGLIRVATVEEVDTHRIKVTLHFCLYGDNERVCITCYISTTTNSRSKAQSD